MKTQINKGGVFTEKVSGYYNLTAVLNNGSTITAQSWSPKEDGAKAAALRVLEWVKDGERPDYCGQVRPVCHVFIHHTGTKVTRHYDMSEPTHVADLQAMAW